MLHVKGRCQDILHHSANTLRCVPLPSYRDENAILFCHAKPVQSWIRIQCKCCSNDFQFLLFVAKRDSLQKEKMLVIVNYIISNIKYMPTYLGKVWAIQQKLFRQYSASEYQVYAIPTYSARNTTSILEIFRGNTPEYHGISLIFPTILHSIEVGIFGFSPSDMLEKVSHN